MAKADFHTAIDSFGEGFGYVIVQTTEDYETGDRGEMVSSDIDEFDLSGGDDKSVSLDGFIAMLQAARDRIPEEFRASAFIAMSCYGEYAHASLKVGYEVEEPEHVKAARHAAEKKAAEARAARDAEAVERRDRAEFERLKAKFKD